MPVSGPVYQPTTVTYEEQHSSDRDRDTSWRRPLGGGYLTQTTMASTRAQLSRPFIQIAILVLGLIISAIGVMMIVEGSVDYGHHSVNIPPSNNNETTAPGAVEVPEDGIDIGVIIGGVFILTLGLLIIGFYVRIAGCRRRCPCIRNSKECRLSGLPTHSGNHHSGGAPHQVMTSTMNPSTDLLVSGVQYSPVSEIPGHLEEEARQLMAACDNKECLSSAEESDRMLESDPRIVLRPLSKHIEDA